MTEQQGSSAAAMFEGVKVLEVAEWTLVPAAAAVLAEFGADVIKVERPRGGDMQRGLSVAGVNPVIDGVALQMEQTNFGGKRSIGIDVRSEEGRALILRLAAQADVFLTSLLPKTRDKVGLDYESVKAANPRIVYASGMGYGSEGADADQGGYDMTAYWCRSGIGYALTAADAPTTAKMRPAMGDKLGSMNLVAGIASALFRRERTGEGANVEVSLMGTAMWQISSDIVYSKALDRENSREARGRNPLVDYYETADHRWIVIALLESDRWWPAFAELAGLTELLDDPRFVDHHARTEHHEECREIVAATVRGRPYAEWVERFTGFGGPWAPLQSPREVADDPQALANGYMSDLTAANGTTIRMVPAPITIDGSHGRLDPCPEAGANTEEILLEFGADWEEIIRLKDAGVIT
ncbi:CoA transferase [Pseudonocardia ailaonensis]|uniref:CoA transferase n=1 Tax=Pseudonocardia ailaonensis TaxID=367279 RepID=A0ABN2NFG0_9PSEU